MSCTPCSDEIVVNIPGAQGDPGDPGTDGIDGTNAFTFITVGANMPNELENVTFGVLDSTWATIGQTVFVQFAGEFEVVSKPSSLTIVLKNLEQSAISAYSGNVPPGTAIPNGAQISPGGKQGVTGVVPGNTAPADQTYITQVPGSGLTQNQALSTLLSGLLKSTTGTGIVSHAVDGADYLSPTTGLEVSAIGVTVQAKNVNLDALSGLAGAADRLPYFTGLGALSLATLSTFIRTLLDDANAAAARLTLGVRYGLLGSGTLLNLNAGAAVDLTSIAINSTKYIVDQVLMTDASISLTTATLGLFGSAGGGVPVICADQSLAALTGSTKKLALTISGAGSTDIITSTALIPRLGTPQGAAATASLWVFGYDIS